ncbi:MAG: heavy-metal-associated domain-containing protein [Thermoanaerobaculales bacterium]|jgi:copper chaperone CopZ|nr:heavy-metal-associated domain-containing protein [Thermoanaerobaculales bacterium]
MIEPTTRTLLIVGLVLVAAATAACGGSTEVSTTFIVEGMTCESCSAAITGALLKIEGVEEASADHLAGTARAVHRVPDAPADRLAAEIESLGYNATAVETTPVGS